MVALTQNGNFLAAMRGIGGDPDVTTMDVGYRFYETKSGVLLYDFECIDSDYQGLGPQDENRFIFNIYKYPDIIEFNIVDPTKKNRYTKEFPSSHLLGLDNGALKFGKEYAVIKGEKDTLWVNKSNYLAPHTFC